MAKQTVSWKPGARCANVAPAEKVYAECEKIRAKHDGKLNPEAMLEAARSKRSVLHKFCEWDDTVAGHQYRLNQMQTVVRLIAVEYLDHPEKGSVRKYVVEPGSFAKGGTRRSYRPLEEMLEDPDTRAVVLQRALAELVSFQRKYRALAELAIGFARLTTHSPAASDAAGLGVVWLARPGAAWRGAARRGKARNGGAGVAWCGLAWQRTEGGVWLGWHGVARRVLAGTARLAWRGLAGKAWQGAARYGRAWRGLAGKARHGLAGLRHGWRGLSGFGTAWHGVTRQGWQGAAWRGEVRSGMLFARHGGARLARHGLAGQGSARRGRRGLAGLVWLGLAAHGVARNGGAGKAGRGGAGQGRARRGKAGKARLGRARRGRAGRGTAWLGKAGKARPGVARLARRGWAWPGVAWRGTAGQGWLGESRRGRTRHGLSWLAWLGLARHGVARRGMARLARRGQARHGAAGRGLSWRGRLGEVAGPVNSFGGLIAGGAGCYIGGCTISEKETHTQLAPEILGTLAKEIVQAGPAACAFERMPPMAGDWIKMRKSLLVDPKVAYMADVCGMTRQQICGWLFEVWCWADTVTTDGVVPLLSLRLVQDITTAPNKLLAAMREVGWIVESADGISFPHFDRHMSESAKNRALATDRKSRQRKEKGDEHSWQKKNRDKVTELSRNCPPDSVTREEKRREEKKREPLSDPEPTSPTDFPPFDNSKKPVAAQPMSSSDEIAQIIGHYQTYHPRSRPGAKERKLIAARLKDGYSVADICEAIDGIHVSPFHSGENERGTKYQGLALVVRESGQVDQFMALWANRDEPVISEKHRRGLRAVSRRSQDLLEIFEKPKELTHGPD